MKVLVRGQKCWVCGKAARILAGDLLAKMDDGDHCREEPGMEVKGKEEMQPLQDRP